MVVEHRWFDSRPPDERDAIETADSGGPVEERSGPDDFDALSAFPYVVGPRFVQAGSTPGVWPAWPTPLPGRR